MIKKIQVYWYWGKNWSSILLAKILIFLGHKYSNLVIPQGHYCYSPDFEKNKKAEPFTYHVIPCKYYKTLGKEWNGCKYLGIITDDFVFDDQCKMCKENYVDLE